MLLQVKFFHCRYNPDQHQEVIEDYAKIEVAKQAVKAQKLQEELLTGKMNDADVLLYFCLLKYLL